MESGRPPRRLRVAANQRHVMPRSAEGATAVRTTNARGFFSVRMLQARCLRRRRPVVAWPGRTSLTNFNEETRASLKEALKWLNTGLGVFLVVVGVTSAGVNDQDGGVIAEQLLSELTLALTFSETSRSLPLLEETSLPALMLLDFFCGAGAAVAFAAS